MTNETKEKITDLLFGVMSKADKLPSLEEKKKFYLGFLERNLDYLDVDEKIDPHSEEIEELITDKFLSIVVDKPKVFEAQEKISNGNSMIDMKNIFYSINVGNQKQLPI